MSDGVDMEYGDEEPEPDLTVEDVAYVLSNPEDFAFKENVWYALDAPQDFVEHYPDYSLSARLGAPAAECTALLLSWYEVSGGSVLQSKEKAFEVLLNGQRRQRAGRLLVSRVKPAQRCWWDGGDRCAIRCVPRPCRCTRCVS